MTPRPASSSARRANPAARPPRSALRRARCSPRVTSCPGYRPAREASTGGTGTTTATPRAVARVPITGSSPRLPRRRPRPPLRIPACLRPRPAACTPAVSQYVGPRRRTGLRAGATRGGKRAVADPHRHRFRGDDRVPAPRADRDAQNLALQRRGAERGQLRDRHGHDAGCGGVSPAHAARRIDDRPRNELIRATVRSGNASPLRNRRPAQEAMFAQESTARSGSS